MAYTVKIMQTHLPTWGRGLAGALLVMVMAGCATPRYQSVKRYEVGSAAPACLASCVEAEQRCKTSCQAKHEACLKSIEPDVQARYQAALKRHAQALNLYRLELDRYRHELMLGWGWGPYWNGPWGYYSWFPPFPPSEPPPSPTLEGERQRLAHERCDQDCGCQGGYDACYLGCGGMITHETQCVANCPAPKP